MPPLPLVQLLLRPQLPPRPLVRPAVDLVDLVDPVLVVKVTRVDLLQLLMLLTRDSLTVAVAVAISGRSGRKSG